MNSSLHRHELRQKHRAGLHAVMMLVEDAVDLLRSAGWRTLLQYYIGTLPFACVFILFYVDLSQFSCGPLRLTLWAAVVGGTFAWMKVWQAIFARSLWRLLLTDDDPEAGSWFELCLRQVRLQSFGLLLLPLSLLAVIPFTWVYAYYQNLTVLDRGRSLPPGTLSREARAQTLENKAPLFLLLWAISPVLVVFSAAVNLLVVPVMAAHVPDGLMVMVYFMEVILLVFLFPLSPLPVLLAGNLLAFLSFAPQLLRMFTGVSVSFAESSGIFSDNLTYVCVVGMVYLVLDPLVKAAFVLRSFRNESVTTGADMRRILQRIRASATGVLLVLGVGLCLAGGTVGAEGASESPAVNETPPVSASATPLDQSIDEVMRDRNYEWRLPGDKAVFENTYLGGLFDEVGQTVEMWSAWLGNLLDRIGGWLRKWFQREQDGLNVSPVSNAFMATYTLALLLAVLALAAGYLYWRRSRDRDVLPVDASSETAAAPDVRDENVLATDLPEDEWARLAARLAAEGDYRGALRAAFLSLLAWLAVSGFVRVARAKSNRDYLGELALRAHARPDCLAAFKEGVETFEPVWYGSHAASDAQVVRIIGLGEQVRHRELL